MPRVTIIVPVYNVESYLCHCVDSVLAQTVSDLEVILIDDGSTDSSGALCDRYLQKDSRVSVIHQENQGLGGARNTGIDAAKGDWVLFVDSDDSISENTLETALAAAEKHRAEIVIFSYQTVDESGTVREVFHEDIIANIPFRLEENKEALISSPTACNKLCRRSLFQKTGIRFPSAVWYEDIRTTLKLMLNAKQIVYVREALYNYLMREGSITKNTNVERNREIISALEDLLQYFEALDKFEAFKEELTYLVILHVYISASVRVLQVDAKNPLLRVFKLYLHDQFPEYKTNRYLCRLSGNKRLVFDFLEKNRYRTLSLLFKIKSRLSR